MDILRTIQEAFPGTVKVKDYRGYYVYSYKDEYTEVNLWEQTLDGFLVELKFCNKHIARWTRPTVSVLTETLVDLKAELAKIRQYLESMTKDL